MPISPAGGDAILSFLIQRGLWLSLHSGDPGPTGVNEVVGCPRGNVSKALGGIADAAAASKTELTIEGVPDARVTYVGLWDAQSGGRFIGYEAVKKPRDFVEGDAARFPLGSIMMMVG